MRRGHECLCTFSLPPASARPAKLSSASQVCTAEWETDRGRHSRHVLGRRCCSRSLYLWKMAETPKTSTPTLCCSAREPSHLFKSLVGNLLACSLVTFACLIMSEFSWVVRNVVTSAFPLSHLMLNQGEKQNWHAKLIL